jgi:hypothetical protein
MKKDRGEKRKEATQTPGPEVALNISCAVCTGATLLDIEPFR